MSRLISSASSGHKEIDCMLVSGIDPLTRNLRTGASLRYNNAPKNVRYKLHLDRLGYPDNLGHYNLGWFSIPLSTARLFTEAAFPLERRGCSLIHSFYWSLHRYPLPWIHENDQSLGQYLSDYVKFEGTLMEKIAGITANMLNAEKCRAVITWSKWARDGYVRDGVDASKIRVMPPPFTVSERRIPHNTTNILFIGRDYKRKGGKIVLKVFEDAKKSFDNIHLTFVGHIPEKEILSRIREDRSISYFERISKRDLHERIFPSSDIFLLPTQAEAYGMSIVEAMSYGMPVVSSSISAIPEVVEEGVSGYLSPPRSFDTFSRKCGELLGDPERRERMGKNAKDKVLREFSPESIGTKLYDLYLECIN